MAADTFQAHLSNYRETTLAGLLSAVPQREPHRHLYGPLSSSSTRTGKGIRPALCLATYRAFGGDASDALASATAIEMLHNAFLVHDDIEDDSDLRRSRIRRWHCRPSIGVHHLGRVSRCKRAACRNAPSGCRIRLPRVRQVAGVGCRSAPFIRPQAAFGSSPQVLLGRVRAHWLRSRAGRPIPALCASLVSCSQCGLTTRSTRTPTGGASPRPWSPVTLLVRAHE